MQLTLASPEITCDHCIATIQRTVDGIEGARFVSGDWQTRQFSVEIDSGAHLDLVAAALEAEGYPLGDAAAMLSAPPVLALEDWRPEYRVTATGAGADVNYACPCSCEAGFAFDRAQSEQSPEHCCCGRTMLVGREAEQRLRGLLDADGFAFDVQTVTMPWGQPLQAALAIPRDGAEHGSHDPGATH